MLEVADKMVGYVIGGEGRGGGVEMREKKEKEIAGPEGKEEEDRGTGDSEGAAGVCGQNGAVHQEGLGEAFEQAGEGEREVGYEVYRNVVVDDMGMAFDIVGSQ